MNLEFKQLEIKEVDDKGTFQGIACKYNNVDGASDRLLKSAGKSNDKKDIPILYQHDINNVIGKGILSDGSEGIMLDAKLFLDKDQDGNMIFPLAYKAYELAKKGLMKLSIGYRVNDYAFKKEKSGTVRELKDIDVMETSMVLFPCNEKAVITSVKQEGGNKYMEEKAMGFADLLKVQQANDMRWKLQDALNCSFRQLMDDSEMDIKEKLAQLEADVDDFATTYKENMSMLLQASAKSKVAKKEVDEILEKKEAEELETKAGKKISKMNKTKLQQCKDMLEELLGSDMVEDDGEGEGKGCKKPATKENDEKLENKQKNKTDDTLELKSEELEILNKISQNFSKGDE